MRCGRRRASVHHVEQGGTDAQLFDEVVELGEGFEFRTQNVFHLQVEGKDPVGRIRVRFVANPSYVMAPALASLFRAAGIDPNKWTGESAQREGRSVEAEVYE